ncbi:TPA: phosphotransferase family protein [Klebsiella pneumoniae]|nr:aminoglycoside phosphotransferase family protein [Klebsiella pneumoniae]UZL84297.1 aminoglycoside phosphotransferase family protein [Klebsiella pneumoniae]HBQ8494512.1 aminoglycoside phosphotransferase family protein [Klebsiella pneumoniae]HBV9907760.1 aminoglycoside phosphotransferase family protein [Klebsiella pneumoniae]HBY9641709.1 aminoglycoside phosphotransferase family protein [Klebsiella pneumoniae]HCF8078058.1 aminoglycoside phosphotransferase family protein [Klebsiella pneumoniae]
MKKKEKNDNPLFSMNDISLVINYATGLELLYFKLIPIGVMTYTILCKAENNREYIMRVYPHGREDILGAEIEIITRCREIKLPVPNVIATSLDGPKIGLSYFVYDKIEGMMLSDYLDKVNSPNVDYVSDQLIDLFKKISSLDIKKYGELESGYKAVCSSWSEFVSNSITQGRKGVISSNILPIHKIKKIERLVLSNLNSLDKVSGKLLWGDVSVDNILVTENGEISGIIDFESCLSGPGDCTIGYFLNTLSPKSVTHASLFHDLSRKCNTFNDDVYSFCFLRAYRLARFIDCSPPAGEKRDMLIDIFPGLEWAICFFNDRINEVSI